MPKIDKYDKILDQAYKDIINKYSHENTRHGN